VVVDTSKKQLEELSYETSDTKASIFLKAKDGQTFSPEDISFGKERAPYDLVFTLDAASLNSLGGLFEQNPEVFYETPKINIDHKAENEFFGAVNLVDLSATSVGEILAQVFEKFEEQLVDEDIATCLLTGIISKTDSFQHARTTPRAFLSASQLIALGGRQQDIVQSLYKTKPLSFLRLWGRVLARLKGEDNQNLMYGVLNDQDFEKAGASPSDLPQALVDLLANVAGKLVVAILAPQNGNSIAFIALHNSVPEERLYSLGLPKTTTQLSPYPYKLLEFSLPEKISEVENKLVESVKGL
jgi:nanoRNase/pAp phosphatase (c-di-AMP/oligoRNAs hydrolase)